jgi:hypothetical protein
MVDLQEHNRAQLRATSILSSHESTMSVLFFPVAGHSRDIKYGVRYESSRTLTIGRAEVASAPLYHTLKAERSKEGRN